MISPGKPVVLYVKQQSNYFKLDVECYDQVRNALSYSGKEPVIAHPPCRLFSRLKRFAKAPACEKILAYSAIATVRVNGGVVEHPNGSSLFADMNIPLDGSRDAYGGYVRRVFMSDFGAKFKKDTLIYIVGVEPGNLPSYPISFDLPTMVIKRSKRSVMPYVSKKDRDMSPLLFCMYLIDIWYIIQQNKLYEQN